MQQPQFGNGFTVLRIAAALSVVLYHTYEFTGTPEWQVATWSDRSIDLGGLAVLTFFGISGYLIAASWSSDPRITVFVRKRLLRIWPALLTLVLVTVFAVGPVMSTLPVHEYLTHPDTWRYLRTVTLAPVELYLPGVFAAHPQNEVNVSLWTLPLEVLCYTLIVVTAALRLFRRGFVVALVVILVVISEGAATDYHRDVALLAAGFAWGGALRLSPGLLRPGGNSLAVLSIAASLLADTAAPVAALGWVYLMIRVGLLPLPRTKKLVAAGDPSYGIYIYGAPVQQVLYAAGLVTPLSLSGVSLLILPLIGYASWHLIEKPCLNFARGERVRPATRTGCWSQNRFRLDASRRHPGPVHTLADPASGLNVSLATRGCQLTAGCGDAEKRSDPALLTRGRTYEDIAQGV